MNRKDALLGLYKVLVDRQRALQKALADQMDQLGQAVAKKSNEDAGDAANGSDQQDISSRLAEVQSRELARIREAIKRARDGKLGVCDACGNNIPMARLNALPYATLCIGCQRDKENGVASAVDQDVDWNRLLAAGRKDAPSKPL